MKNTIAGKYKCGTLEYTVFQLGSVIFWMLWGALAMSMLGSTFNVASPFLFRNNGLSDTFIAVVMGTIFSWMNVVINPILSTVSDNCRSRLGRRIPFIFYTALPTAIFISAMPFYPYLCKFMPGTVMGFKTLTLMLGAGAIIYHFFYLFIAILYYYLIPDVVPAELMGRYYGFFRVVSVLGGVAFNKCVFPYAASHPQYIYPAAGAFYLVSVLFLCFFVREGKYPAVAPKDTSKPFNERVFKAVGEYCRECFGSKYYWLYYIAGVVIGLSACINMFMNFFYIDGCGMSMKEIGQLGVYVGIVQAVTCFGAGFVVDKFGAFKTTFAAQLAMSLLYIGSGIFVNNFASALCWRIPLAVASGISAVAGGRILVEVLPRSKFGMIASGRNLLVSLFVGIANYPVGLFSDFLKNAAPGTSIMLLGYDLMPLLKGYRFVNYWAGITIGGGFAVLLYFYLACHRKRTDKACDL